MAENNKLIAVIMTVVIGVILVGSLLVPVINDRVADTHVYYNNDAGALSKAAGTDITNLDFSISTGEKPIIAINGADPIDIVGGIVQVAMSDVLSINVSGTGAEYKVVYVVNDTVTEIQAATHIVINADGTNVTMTVTPKSSEPSEPVTLKMNWIFYYSNDGDYRAMNGLTPTRDVYLNDISELYGSAFAGGLNKYFVSISNNAANVVYVDGSSKELAFNPDTKKVMDNVVSINYGRTGTFAIDVPPAAGGEAVPTTPTIIVPYSVVGVSDSDAAGNGLLVAIPVVVIAALLLFVIGSMAGRRE